jgi:DivIVA domain-containing protein
VDRDSIQRRDFPTGRKGYDPAAVDEHLRRVADEFERSGAPIAHRPLSSGASEQVRVILEAAERGAAELRAKAGEEASDHVARVRGAADGLLGRLDELERELGGLLDALRTSGERLSAGLAELQARVAEDARPGGDPEEAAAAPGPVTPPATASHGPGEPPPATGRGPVEPPPAPVRGAGEPPAAGRGPVEPPPAAHPAPPEPAAVDALDAQLTGADEAGARLIALNMALGGTPREETARYLADHFALADLDALLDDVYTRAGQ